MVKSTMMHDHVIINVMMQQPATVGLPPIKWATATAVAGFWFFSERLGLIVATAVAPIFVDVGEDCIVCMVTHRRLQA